MMVWPKKDFTMPIITRSEWKTLYPEAEYRTKSPRVKEHLFHFCLGLDEPESQIIKLIDTIKGRAKLTSHDAKCHELTPLIIAVMQGKREVVDKLLSCPEVQNSIDAKDAYGWTAYHHAALVSDEIARIILGAGANKDAKTNLGGSFEDIQRMTTLQKNPPRNVTFKGAPITEEVARSQFGMESFQDEVYFSPSQLKALWQMEKWTLDPNLSPLTLNSIKEPPPKLQVAEVQTGLFGLVADEDIEPGSYIGEYTGEYRGSLPRSFNFESHFSEEDRELTSYLIDPYDAKSIGGSIRFINCGPSNANFMQVNIRGAKRVVVISTERIKKGDPIYLNYGLMATNVSFGPQILFNKEKICSFFAADLNSLFERYEQVLTDVFNLFPNLDPDHSSFKNTPLVTEVLSLKLKLLFPLSNPIALLYLHCKGLVDINEWYKLIDSGKYSVLTAWKTNNATFLPQIYHLYSKYQEVEENLRERKTVLRKWMIENLEKYSLTHLIRAMDLIQEAVLSNQTEFAKSVENELENYNWRKDESHLFSVNGIALGIKKEIERQVSLMSTTAPLEEIIQASVAHDILKNQKEPGFIGSSLDRALTKLLLERGTS